MMAYKFLAFCLVMVGVQVAMLAGATEVLNETCFDGGVDVGVVLEFGFYQNNCPEAEAIIFSWVETAISQDPRMAASLLRLHFHDCFVNGCDASVLLDDTEDFVGEKTAPPNLNSLRGFEVIDTIKSELESVCPETVSCADILAVVARDSVTLSGGLGWQVQLGRRDSLSASNAAVTKNIPAPNSTVSDLVSKFENVGLGLIDMVALSGAHTIGKARCPSFAARLQGGPTPAGGNPEFIQSLQQLCSGLESGTTVADLDLATPATFDNQYYVNLLSGEGLLQSDQALVSENEEATRQLVETYAEDPDSFLQDFKDSMVRMGSLVGLVDGGEVRRSCRCVN